jgi:hypothetical protein
MIFVQPGATFETTLDGAPSGIALEIQIEDTPDGGVIQAWSSVGIVESPAGSGNYAAQRVAPIAEGTYSVFWRQVGSSTPIVVRDVLRVTASLSGGVVVPDDDATARARASIALDCNASAEPVLTEADLDQLLLGARREDVYGYAPNEAGWTPTYDLNAAKGRGWRIKQARVAGTQTRSSFEGDYQSADYRSLDFGRLAERFEKRAIGSISISAL